jgi:hypothetical protein
VEYGTLPDWIEAVATALGFLFGLILLRNQLEEHRARDRQHAEKVSVTFGEEGLGSGITKVTVVNGGSAPIHNCLASLHAVTPTDDNKLVGQADLRVIPAGESRSHNFGFSSVGVVVNAVVEFTDANSKRWRRDVAGNITPL